MSEVVRNVGFRKIECLHLCSTPSMKSSGFILLRVSELRFDSALAMASCDHSELRLCINLKGRLGTETYGKLAVEFLKYTLYLRGQIPCLFDQARSILQTKNESENGNDEIPRTRLKGRRQKKIDEYLATFDLLFEHVKAAVTEIPVAEAVFSMGATLVSPKELYILTFPSRSECPRCEDDLPLNQQSCIRNFFRKIASADVVSTKDNSSLMKIAVLLKIPRESGINDYMNIRNYKIPKKVKRTTIQVNGACCDHHVVWDSDDRKIRKTSVSDSKSNEVLIKQLECLNLESIEKEGAYCWVQLLPVASGFKDTVTSSSEEDIWISTSKTGKMCAEWQQTCQ